MNNYVTRDSISEENFSKWMEFEKNVLIFGDHGTGKTSCIKNFWDKIGIKYAMFSGATLDPWCDMAGIPRLVKRNKESVIEFARPKIMDDDLEAIFIDEYNRSPAAVRNFVLELTQFKSINGRRFPKLKVVWAAANPPDTDNNYDVENIDPSQEDRFHVIVKLSGKPNFEYFSNKYGEEVAKGSLKWYENLAPEIKKIISPRRLDYGLDYVLNEGGEARDIFPDERVNVSLFTRSIRGNKKLKELLNITRDGNEEEIKTFFKSQVNVQPCLKEILKSFDLSNSFIKYGDTEEIMSFANSDEAFSILVYDAAAKNDNIKSSLNDYRKIHSKNPVWFENAHRTVLSSKVALEHFLENKDLFSHARQELKIGDISTLLSFKSPEEIVDEINCLESAAIYEMNEDSAKNVLDFYSRIDLKDFNDKNRDSNWIKKTYSLIYSAFDTFYLRDANLLGASFVSKGCERVMTAPPFAIQGRAASGNRGAHGKVAVREESI